jgi:hypothetical protein
MSMPNNVYKAIVSAHDKMFALPKYINISITSIHLFLSYCFSSFLFFPLWEMMLSFRFPFHSSTCLFISPVPPLHLALYFIKIQLMLWVPYYFFSLIPFDTFYDSLTCPLRLKHHDQNAQETRSTAHFHHSSRQGERSRRWWTYHVQTFASRNRTTPMLRPNTDIARNELVTWPRNQLLIRDVMSSPIHYHDTVTCWWRNKCVPRFTLRRVLVEENM